MSRGCFEYLINFFLSIFWNIYIGFGGWIFKWNELYNCEHTKHLRGVLELSLYFCFSCHFKEVKRFRLWLIGLWRIYGMDFYKICYLDSNTKIWWIYFRELFDNYMPRNLLYTMRLWLTVSCFSFFFFFLYQ